MSYAIIRTQKLKSFSGIGRHIDRVDADGNNYSPDNAEVEKVTLNIHWDRSGKGLSQNQWKEVVGKNYSLGARVKERIQEGYKVDKAIRKDAVKAIEYM